MISCLSQCNTNLKVQMKLGMTGVIYGSQWPHFWHPCTGGSMSIFVQHMTSVIKCVLRRTLHRPQQQNNDAGRGRHTTDNSWLPRLFGIYPRLAEWCSLPHFRCVFGKAMNHIATTVLFIRHQRPIRNQFFKKWTFALQLAIDKNPSHLSDHTGWLSLLCRTSRYAWFGFWILKHFLKNGIFYDDRPWIHLSRNVQ